MVAGRRWRLWLAVSLAAAALGAAATGYWWLYLRTEPGMVRYDPDARLDPARTYSLQLWDYRWPTAPDGTPYESWLRSTLAEFGRRHPNVRVEYRLLDPAGGAAELEEALRQGRPPDVYATWPGQPVFYDRRLQVPADLYFTREERGRREAPPAYVAAALRAAGHGGRLSAWPRFLVAHLWPGHREALARAGLDVRAVTGQGWDWNSLSAALSARPEREAGLIVNPLGTAAFEDLLHARAGPSGSPLWTRQGVAEVAAWLAQLRHSELLTVPAPEEAGDVPIGHLLGGRALAVAGASPWLVAKLAYLQPGGPGDGPLVLLPVPTPPGNPPALRLEASVLIVFRQRDYQGHNHTRAAVELARYLSTARHPWALPGTPILPAYRPAWEEWRMAGGFPPALVPLVESSSGPEGGDAGAATARARHLADASEALAAFWSGRLDHRALAERLGREAPPAPPAPPWWRRLLP